MSAEGNPEGIINQSASLPPSSRNSVVAQHVDTVATISVHEKNQEAENAIQMSDIKIKSDLNEQLGKYIKETENEKVLPNQSGKDTSEDGIVKDGVILTR